VLKTKKAMPTFVSKASIRNFTVPIPPVKYFPYIDIGKRGQIYFPLFSAFPALEILPVSFFS